MRLPDPACSYTVLIGTSSYQSDELADLPSVRNNLNALATALTNPQCGGFTPGHCTVLPDHTDARAIHHVLRQDANHARDTLLVYFAGHGLTGPRRHELYLGLGDTDPDELRVSALPFDWIREIFLDSPATNRVLILDCCYSGRAVADFMASSAEAILGQTEIAGTYTIASATADTLALAPTGATYTTFTGELVDLLHHGLPDGPELLTLDTIYRHLRHTTTTKGLPRPSQRATDTTDLLALTRNPAHGTPSLVLPRLPEATIPVRYLLPTPTPPTPSASLPTATPPSTLTTLAPQTDRVPARSRPTRTAVVMLAVILTVIAGVLPGSGKPSGIVLTGHTESVWGVAFSPDGRTLATAGHDKTVRLWQVGSGRSLGAPLTGHTDWIWDVAFSPDGRTLATASRDKTVQLWDIVAHHQIGESLTGHTRQIRGVAFSPDGRVLATASDDKTVRLWNVASRRPIGDPLTHTKSVFGVAFSPDGRTLATGSVDTTVQLWDVTTHLPIGEFLTGHTRYVWGVAFSPDGRTLATTSDDKTVRLWDVTNPTAARPIGAPLAGHTDTVRGVLFSPDGRTLITSSEDKTVRLWEVTSGRPLGAPLTGHTDAIRDVAISPDGRTLATAGRDNTVRLLNLKLP